MHWVGMRRDLEEPKLEPPRQGFEFGAVVLYKEGAIVPMAFMSGIYTFVIVD